MDEKKDVKEQKNEDTDAILGLIILGATAIVSYKLGNYMGRSLREFLITESYQQGVHDTIKTLLGGNQR